MLSEIREGQVLVAMRDFMTLSPSGGDIAAIMRDDHILVVRAHTTWTGEGLILNRDAPTLVYITIDYDLFNPSMQVLFEA